MGGEVCEMRRGWAGGRSGGLREEGAVVFAIGRSWGVGSACEIKRHSVFWLRLMRKMMLLQFNGTQEPSPINVVTVQVFLETAATKSRSFDAWSTGHQTHCLSVRSSRALLLQPMDMLHDALIDSLAHELNQRTVRQVLDRSNPFY